MTASRRLGAFARAQGGCRFEVWAPRAAEVEVVLTEAQDRRPMRRHAAGYYRATLEHAPPGTRYVYRLTYADGSRRQRPDPASRSQPEGVHGASRVLSVDFSWTDGGWCGLPLSRYVIYELHVGAFSPEGTFDAVAQRLDELADLGVTALELMPVGQFPGHRNWGYDGTYPFAVQESYGGAEGLKRLVDACHRKGLAVVLDVVYNHLGPEGNYLRDFGPYFTDFYRTPWGEAVNFDGPESDEVRRYFIENALQWVGEFHVDALRLDAVHAILDFSARPFLEELGLAVRREAEARNRRIHLIAESALNDTRVIRPRELGGFNLDAQWNDDFHHCLHTALTGEGAGYYRDYNGPEDLARAWRDGYVYSGRYSAFHRRSHGNSSRSVPARRLVVFSQNHDQVGNRVQGERLAALVSFEKLKLAAGLVLLSPFVPLIFMGEEYGETAPFLYFVSHGDPDLVQAVREGRRQEFAAFGWQADPPDPQDEQTFLRSKLNRRLKDQGSHRVLRDFYRELLRLRSAVPALSHLSKKDMQVRWDRRRRVLCVRRRFGDGQAAIVFAFDLEPTQIAVSLPSGSWRKRIDSAETRWEGPGSRLPDTLQVQGDLILAAAPHSVLLLTSEDADARRT